MSKFSYLIFDSHYGPTSILIDKEIYVMRIKHMVFVIYVVGTYSTQDALYLPT